MAKNEVYLKGSGRVYHPVSTFWVVVYLLFLAYVSLGIFFFIGVGVSLFIG